MKVLNNRYTNLRLKSFDWDPNTDSFDGVLDDDRRILAFNDTDAVLIGIGENTYDARKNLEEVLQLGQNEIDVGEKELFRVLKWQKV